MNVLILNGPRDPRTPYNPLYRGTYRSHPTHCDELPDNHEINRLFFWFIEEGGELGVVQDLPKAQRLAELWNARLNEPEHFEVVEATNGDTAAFLDKALIGFDLSAGYNNSLLVGGLTQTLPIDLPEPIRDRWNLTKRQYAPQLNSSGLFETFETATLCLGSLIALQELSPNLFEGGNLRDFQPVRLRAITQKRINLETSVTEG